VYLTDRARRAAEAEEARRVAEEEERKMQDLRRPAEVTRRRMEEFHRDERIMAEARRPILAACEESLALSLPEIALEMTWNATGDFSSGPSDVDALIRYARTGDLAECEEVLLHLDRTVFDGWIVLHLSRRALRLELDMVTRSGMDAQRVVEIARRVEIPRRSTSTVRARMLLAWCRRVAFAAACELVRR
jgi:hypothetical protein